MTLLSANRYVTKNRNGGMLMGKTFHHKGDQKHARTMQLLRSQHSRVVKEVIFLHAK